MATLTHLAEVAAAYYKANPGTCTTVLMAVYAWWNNLFSAFTASLPNPDDPGDWGMDGSFRTYRLFFKTMRQWSNQKPQPVPVPPVRPQEMLPPKA